MKTILKEYQNKTVVVTGHTGFKGSWLTIWLLELGAKVIGYALDPVGEKDNFVLSNLTNKVIDIRGDIRDKEKLQHVFDTYQPDMVFHLAAQPLVRESYTTPVETYEINVMGTINVLECIRHTPSTKIGVMVTTDKCYENKEQIWGYKESDPMGGYDPYSSSKGAAELAIQSWRQSFMNPNEYEKHGKAIASVRAGNVIGGGDWAKDRIIPDCIRALEKDKSIEVRNPKAIRPWQHVLEPLSGYLLLGAKMLREPTKYCEGWNFGPYLGEMVPVWDIANSVANHYGKGQVVRCSNEIGAHEAQLLNLDISKAVLKLGWRPCWSIDKGINKTVDWYRYYNKKDAYELCRRQIKEYTEESV